MRVHDVGDDRDIILVRTEQPAFGSPDVARKPDDLIIDAYGLKTFPEPVPFVNEVVLILPLEEATKAVEAVDYDSQRTHEAAQSVRSTIGSAIVRRFVWMFRKPDDVERSMPGELRTLAGLLEQDSNRLRGWRVSLKQSIESPRAKEND